MKIRIALAMGTALALAACGNKAEKTDPGLTGATAAASSSAPTSSASSDAAAAATTAAAASAPAVAAGGAPTKDYLVGTWAEEGDCTLQPIEFKAGGVMVGPFERWELDGDMLTMVGNPSKIKLSVVDQNTMQSRLGGKGEPRKLVRCK